MGQMNPPEERPVEGSGSHRAEEIVQVNVEEDMTVRGGGHVVKDREIVDAEETPRPSRRRTALIIALIVGLVLLLAPLIMSAAWMGRILVFFGAVGWLWLAIIAVILLFGVLTGYFLARRNV